jgi:hypothetical protein
MSLKFFQIYPRPWRNYESFTEVIIGIYLTNAQKSVVLFWEVRMKKLVLFLLFCSASFAEAWTYLGPSQKVLKYNDAIVKKVEREIPKIRKMESYGRNRRVEEIKLSLYCSYVLNREISLDLSVRLMDEAQDKLNSGKISKRKFLATVALAEKIYALRENSTLVEMRDKVEVLK